MSRIGKQPVPIPAGVTVTKGGDRQITVKGPKGELSMKLRPEIDVKVETNTASVATLGDAEEREVRAYHGMTRALLANMVHGVVKGYEKRLEVQGVGWNAAAQGNKLVLNVGYNRPVTLEMPKGLTVATPLPTQIVLFGPDKQAVGHMASTIRKARPPEPYKGKGIRYEGEIVKRKAGKSFGT
jgi:large subunit ribosomal protein L6